MLGVVLLALAALAQSPSPSPPTTEPADSSTTASSPPVTEPEPDLPEDSEPPFEEPTSEPEDPDPEAEEGQTDGQSPESPSAEDGSVFPDWPFAYEIRYLRDLLTLLSILLGLALWFWRKAIVRGLRRIGWLKEPENPPLHGTEAPVLQPQEEPHREQATLRLDFRETVGNDPLGWLEWRARLVQQPVGREAEFEDLLQWARNGPEEPRIRLLHGVGGVGKTRLAAEVALELRNEGWEAGFLKREGSLDLPMKGPGTLVLVDYPEEQRDRVRELLKRFSGEGELPQHRLRILLVSRYGPGFWNSEVDDHNLPTLMDADVHFEPLGEEALFELFQRAQQRTPREASSPEPREVSQEEFRVWLSQSQLHRLPLFVTAAAINSVHEPRTRAVDLSGRQTVLALARRELKRLRGEGPAVGLAKKTLPRLTALAALAGGLDAAALRRLAARSEELGLGSLDPATVMDALHPTGRLRGNTLPAPQPDLVAAALLTEVVRGHLSSEAVWAVLEGDVEEGLQRFGRLAFDAEVTLGLDDGGLSELIAGLFRGDLERCRAAEPVFYEAVAQPLARLGRLVLAAGLEEKEEPERRSMLLTTFSNHLYELGNHKGALAAIREAVEICRGLSSSDPARYAPDLASSLNNLSNRLSDSGDREGALAVIREAVETYRSLASSNSARYAPELALSLNNLSIRLSDSGDREGALAAIREAVEIDRSLASSNPARYAPELAMSLNNLSLRLAESGDREGALVAIREAVELIEPFAAQYPKSQFGDWHRIILGNLQRWQEE
jgi:tetratricopeptide (TPR) repeat protein